MQCCVQHCISFANSCAFSVSSTLERFTLMKSQTGVQWKPRSYLDGTTKGTYFLSYLNQLTQISVLGCKNNESCSKCWVRTICGYVSTLKQGRCENSTELVGPMLTVTLLPLCWFLLP